MSETKAYRGTLVAYYAEGGSKFHQACYLRDRHGVEFEDIAEGGDCFHPDWFWDGFDWYRKEIHEEPDTEGFCITTLRGGDSGDIDFVISYHNGGASMDEVLKESVNAI